MLFCSSVLYEEEASCNFQCIIQLGWKEEREKRPNSSFSMKQMKKYIYLLKLSKESWEWDTHLSPIWMLNGFKSIYTSLDVFFIVIVTDHRHESFEPWKLMEILHGIDVRICTTWWGLMIRLMVCETESTSEKSLDQCQLRSLFIWICIHHSRQRLKWVPRPLLKLLCRLSYQILSVILIPECTLTRLLAVPVFRTTRITELMPTPASF